MGHLVLILFPGSLGDFLCLTPALKAVGGTIPGRKMTVAAQGHLHELVQRLPGVSNVVSLELGLFAQLFSLPGGSSEEAFRFFSSFAEIFSWFGHAHTMVRANLNRYVPGRVQSFPFFTGQKECHASAYYLRCVGVEEVRGPSLRLGEQEREWVKQYWRHQGWLPPARVLAIHPGSGGHRKRWMPEGFMQVARWWQERKNSHVLVLLGPAEEQEADVWRLVGRVEKNLSVLQVAALLSRVDLYVGNDSGVSHVAGAVGARGVVLFGPTRPKQWRPLGGMLSVIQNVSYRKVLPNIQGISLEEVSPEAVIARLRPSVG